MKILKLFLVIFFIFPINNLKADNEVLKNKITKNLRCLICQGQSVYDSDSEFANSLKIVVDNKINEGLSENQIYSYFQSKYGDWILYDPLFNKNTYFLWLLPLLIFFVGGAIIFNKFYLLNIWSSWCVPCKQEHPILMELSQNSDLEIIGINYKDTKKNANDFLKDLGNPYDNIIFDNKGTNAIEWGAYGVPESFLINNNKIIKKYIGPLSKVSMEEIKSFIK